MNEDLKNLGQILLFTFVMIVLSMAIIFVIYFAGVFLGAIIADRTGTLLAGFILCIMLIGFLLAADQGEG